MSDGCDLPWSTMACEEMSEKTVFLLGGDMVLVHGAPSWAPTLGGSIRLCSIRKSAYELRSKDCIFSQSNCFRRGQRIADGISASFFFQMHLPE